MISRRLSVALPLLAAAVLSGCGEDAPAEAAPRTAATSTTAPSPSASPEPSTAAPTTPAPVMTPTPVAATPTPAAGPATVAPAAGPARASTAARPKEALVAQGGQYWGVYLASSAAADDAAVGSAYRRLQGMGYLGSTGGLCDDGDLASIGINQGDGVTSVYFGSRAEALQFIDLWKAPYRGYAQVRTYCAD